MMTNIYAHTETQEAGYQYYPGYISVNVDEEGNVTFTVRSKEEANAVSGATASLTLTPAQFEEFARIVFAYKCCGNA